MEIVEIRENKNRYMDLLLIADENIKMINEYLYTGRLFILKDNDLKSVCVVIEDNNELEIKNLATFPKYENMGYASKLLSYILNKFNCKNIIKVGTSKGNIEFYKKFNFKYSYKIKDFFIKNYDRKIIENGKVIKDMYYLVKIKGRDF